VIPIKPALRVRRELTHAASPTVAAVVESVRADVETRQGPEFAEWWAGRVSANPALRWILATPGYDPYGETPP
jgi:hypothetical protein